MAVAIGQRCGCWFVDHPDDMKTRELASQLGHLALRVIEVRRHRDNGRVDRTTDILLR